MFVISFDIGKCNFAFYIEEFDEKKFEDIKNIPKIKRFNSDGTPTEEFANILSEIYLNGNTILYKNLDLTKDSKKEKYLDQKVCLNMITELDKHKDKIDKCSVVIIEQQMSFQNTRNTMAIKLAQNCASYFLHRYGMDKELIEFPAYHKTQVLGAPKKGGKAMSKPERKKWATEKAIEIIMERGESETLEEISGKKKKDDLADVLIQLQSFKYLRYVEKAM
uniref:Mitochondrial resolvase Ydc2 catalytic domain-containing protein n=1 Tax=viral metagenome TaxID=1070528 RepID=A0A6C0KTG2_9ZZZZ